MKTFTWACRAGSRDMRRRRRGGPARRDDRQPPGRHVHPAAAAARRDVRLACGPRAGQAAHRPVPAARDRRRRSPPGLRHCLRGRQRAAGQPGARGGGGGASVQPRGRRNVRDPLVLDGHARAGRPGAAGQAAAADQLPARARAGGQRARAALRAGVPAGHHARGAAGPEPLRRRAQPAAALERRRPADRRDAGRPDRRGVHSHLAVRAAGGRPAVEGQAPAAVVTRPRGDTHVVDAGARPAVPPGTCPFTVDKPVMAQRWERLTFLHWSFDPPLVQRLLPAGLAAETFGGVAWVGLVPFYMRVATAGGSRAPWVSNFCETNVRTYVRDAEGRSGIWFFSLDAARLGAVVVARTTYRLPYFWSSMRLAGRGQEISYTCIRRWPGPRDTTSGVRIGIGGPLRAGELDERDHYLTARWILFSVAGARYWFARACHPPWPLHRAEALAVDDRLVAAAGLPRQARSLDR